VEAEMPTSDEISQFISIKRTKKGQNNQWGSK